MARLVLEHALPAGWVDEVFEAHRQQQYSRELLFSTVVELTTLVSLGLRPSLHAAACQMPALPVSLGSLYDKVNHTEPCVLRALVRGSAERLGPVMAAVDHGAESLPGWRLRVLDGNHLPASEKRLLPLRGFRGAALPGQSLVVYDPDLGLVVDLVACEDAHASERAAVAPLLEGARPGELWIADRHYCTRTVLGGLEDAGAGFIVREHGRHPRLVEQGAWCACGRTGTGEVREQEIAVAQAQAPQSASLTSLRGIASRWRRVELALDQPTEDGDTTIRLWSNLPEAVGAQRIAELYRMRWRIEGMFGRLESVLHSELGSLGHPRAALLGFAVAVLAYNVLTLLQRAVEQAHQPPAAPPAPPLEVSCFHLGVQVRGGYEGLLIALPPEHWPRWDTADPAGLAQHLLRLARSINPRQVATSKRAPKTAKPKSYVDGKTARTHVATARLLAAEKTTP
ncbi:MAG TPA: IS4 family transposase [Acetobacteraceae bacterium]